MRRAITFSAAALLSAAPNVFAQLASDQIPHQRLLPPSEQVRRELETSRVRLGIFRVRPAFAIRDFGYDNNVFGTPKDPVADWRSTISAGANLIVPFGRKMYGRATVVPEYTWYRKLSERRLFGGTYGGSLLGLFNHLTIEGGANAHKGFSVISSELEREAVGRRTASFGTAELEIVRRFSIFGTAREERQRYSHAVEARAVNAASLAPLERNERLARAGIRYRLTSFLSVSVAAEKTRSEFLTATERNNESDAVIAGIRYDRPRTFFNFSAGSRTGKARREATAFPRYTTATGSYYAAHEFPVRTVIDVYGHRGLVYSLYADNAYFIETRNGAGLVVPLGRRLAVRAFGETGSNRYPRAVESVKRSDDVATYGGGLAIRLYRSLALTAIATNTRYTSNVPGLDRSILRVMTIISIQRELLR
jgi:hypothetical protein